MIAIGRTISIMSFEIFKIVYFIEHKKLIMTKTLIILR